MYNVKQGGTIQRGDLIAIANNNELDVAIYFGQGRGGTVQYYSPNSVANSKKWWEEAQKDARYGMNGKSWGLTRVVKHYLQNPRSTRIMKLNRDNITDQKTIEDIQKAKEILQEFNITVNY
jgi:hypothetical protein